MSFTLTFLFSLTFTPHNSSEILHSSISQLLAPLLLGVVELNQASLAYYEFMIRLNITRSTQHIHISYSCLNLPDIPHSRPRHPVPSPQTISMILTTMILPAMKLARLFCGLSLDEKTITTL